MVNLFQYDFIIRGLVAGLIIAIIAPVIGIFLVLRRYSLIADTLSHVSLAGIALGLLLKINPLFTAIGATTLSSVIIDKLRLSRKVYGESALALFLSGSLAFAVTLLSITHGFTSALFSYLFGSIATVSSEDIRMVLILGILIFIAIFLLYKELFYISFDEESAKVSGVNVQIINVVFIVLAAITISLAIPVVGILLISALLVIPVITALQFKRSFVPTILIAQFISLLSVLAGVVISFYFNIAPGGTIVLLTIFIYILVEILTT